MTAPVTRRPEGKAWAVRFIMQRSWTMGDPTGHQRSPREFEAHSGEHIVAMRFSGLANGALIQNEDRETSSLLGA